jgi:circadian clock protein KaiC
MEACRRGGPPCSAATLAVARRCFGLNSWCGAQLASTSPGVFVPFEETAEELADNVGSLGFDLDALTKARKLHVDHVHVEPREIEETGEFDLDGLFVRLGHSIKSIGAKRVVLDTLEPLFASLPNENIIRAELRRLFRWLKDQRVTAIITAERERDE